MIDSNRERQALSPAPPVMSEAKTTARHAVCRGRRKGFRRSLLRAFTARQSHPLCRYPIASRLDDQGFRRNELRQTLLQHLSRVKTPGRQGYLLDLLEGKGRFNAMPVQKLKRIIGLDRNLVMDIAEMVFPIARMKGVPLLGRHGKRLGLFALSIRNKQR
jgi:hypothetical protein